MLQDFLNVSDHFEALFFKQLNLLQKQPSRGVLRKRCSENTQQIYRALMPKWDFNYVAKQLY